MARVYVLKTYSDGSTALGKLTVRQAAKEHETGLFRGWTVETLTKREARKALRSVDVVPASLAEELQP